MKKNKNLYLIALLPFILMVLAYEILPLVGIVTKSFLAEGTGTFTLGNFQNIFSKKLYQTAIINSVIISIFSSIVGLIVAFFGSKWANESSEKVKNTLMSILNMVSNFSGIPLAFAYIILLGNVGVLVNFGKAFGIDALATFNIYSMQGLLLTYIYFQIPLAILLMIPSFSSLKPQCKEAVSLLGGNSFHYWFKVAIPVLFPAILGTFSVLFSNALSAYATAYALLMNNISLLPIRISEQFVGDVVQRVEFGSALAVVMMLLMVISILLQRYILKQNSEVK